MKKIIVPVLVCLSVLLLTTEVNAQSSGDTTKTVNSGAKRVKVKTKTKVDTKFAQDSTKQNKITVNDDGVTGKKRTKKVKATQENNSPERKEEEKNVQPKKED